MDKKPNKKDTKIFKILSYLGILVLVPMFVDDVKNDKEVRFHVGQGLLVFLMMIAIVIINNGIIANIFVDKQSLFGVTYVTGVSGLGVVIMYLLWLIPIIFAIIGLINVNKDQQKELPIIGKLAFYK